MKPITLKPGQKLTLDQARQLFPDITAHEQQAEMKLYGPWQTITSFKALCVRQEFHSVGKEITIYGYRTLTNIRQSGYELEGYVSIGGKKYTAFTSSHLFELENGHLIDVSIIFPRVK